MNSIILPITIEYPCNISSKAMILSGVKIGINTNIGIQSTIGPNSTIGSGCYINNNVNICEGVTVEDRVFIGPSTVFTNVRYPRAFINPGGHDNTLVKIGASIGANVTVRGGITIGSYAMVGAGSVVLKDVPDYALVAGNPARHLSYVCWCGRKLTIVGSISSAEGQEFIFECGLCKTRHMNFQYLIDREGNVRRGDGDRETTIQSTV